MNKTNTALSLLCLSAMGAVALTVEAIPTHGVFYAGLENQVCQQLRITADSGDVGKTITSLSFSTGKTTNPADITNARLYSSTQNYFTLNTGDDNTRARQIASTNTAQVGTMTFNIPAITINSAGTTYLWLVYDIAAGAKGNNKIDANCYSVMVNGTPVLPTLKLGSHVKKRVYATVYPFKHRIVPYYRSEWVDYRKTHLNATHFKSFTDIINFGYSLTASGAVTFQMGENYCNYALDRMKSLRGSAKSRIIAGFGHVDGGLTAFYQNNPDRNARKAIAANIAKYVLAKGYDGVDIDWEYPDADGEWIYLTYLIADLREELAGSGLSVSIAATMFYKRPWHDVSDQVDFLSTMSYDLNGEGVTEHSPMWLMQNDAVRCSGADKDGAQQLNMPKCKVVLGLPFYTKGFGNNWDQFGYDDVISSYPSLSPAVNACVMGGRDHSFNGANLIKEKCKWVKNNGYGGVMIWAYDRDVMLNNTKSLGKAMYSVLKQTRR